MMQANNNGLACSKREIGPGSGRVQVTVMDESGPFNPAPAMEVCDEAEATVELYLSQERLELLCGTNDLSQVTSLEICVDTQENSLGNFGSYLPKLVQLKMNNSVLISTRNLGTTLSHLHVLWMSCCCLQDLDGISTLSSLRELYLAFNNVSDLSPVGMLENLQVLDLEGNDVNDLIQIQYLRLCGKLQTLTLEGNPVCLQPNPTTTQIDYNYRETVSELVPQLSYLDNARVEDGSLGSSSTMWEEWAILRNCLRHLSQASTEDQTEATGAYSWPSSSRRLASSLRPPSLAGTTRSRPISTNSSRFPSSPLSTPDSEDSDLTEVSEDSSVLTHGAGKIVFCGNPVKAIRARREKLKTVRCMSAFTPLDQAIHVQEHMLNPPDIDGKESNDVLAEVRTWREEHCRHHKEIQRDRLPQVLVVQHGNDYEQADYDEREGFDTMSSEKSDEEHCDPSPSNSSLKSKCKDSLKPMSADVDPVSCGNIHFPCPPLNSKSASGRKNPIGIRAHRIRINPDNSEQKLSCSEGYSVVKATSTSQADMPFKQQLTRINKPCPPSPFSITHPYKLSNLGGQQKDFCFEMDVYSLATKVNCPRS
ncbi:leucine-rich repeat-containing protein 56 isoform X1 [Hippocampus zosterae]|uniref:leucine-rich repeat-containing protein 56 isoform X1 n=2 Tax=Hippocampus zosterae TaxID=109293 RepID=UPI00223CCB7E|nr:leucine-rich repeat-containing protein 56 isoform X1 [Hippocampus zosterae]